MDFFRTIKQGFESYSQELDTDYNMFAGINVYIFILYCIFLLFLPLLVGGYLLFVYGKDRSKKIYRNVGLSMIIVALLIPISALYLAGRGEFRKEKLTTVIATNNASQKATKDQNTQTRFKSANKQYYILPATVSVSGQTFIKTKLEYIQSKNQQTRDMVEVLYSKDGKSTDFIMRDGLLDSNYASVRCSENQNPCKEVSTPAGVFICDEQAGGVYCKLDLPSGRQLWLLHYNASLTDKFDYGLLLNELKPEPSENINPDTFTVT